MSFEITDLQTGAPIEEAVITVMSTATDKVFGHTDKTGKVSMTPKNEITQIVIHAPGYAAIRRYTSGEKVDAEQRQLKFVMEKGVRVAGRVVDETGAPLPDAKVMFAADKEYAGHDQELDTLARSATTAADGTWSYDGLPGDVKIKIGVWHPACLTEKFAVPMADVPDLDALHEGKFESTLTHGVPVNLRVLDPDGNPVTARLIYGDRAVNIAVRPILDTAADGTLRVGIPANTEQYFTVKAKGCAPELVTAKVGTDPVQLTVDLKPQQTLEGQVVDRDGKPVPHASINIASWRGVATLRMINSLVTDGDGKFVWKTAPTDEVQLSVRAEDATITAPATAGQANVIKLP